MEAEINVKVEKAKGMWLEKGGRWSGMTGVGELGTGLIAAIREVAGTAF